MLCDISESASADGCWLQVAEFLQDEEIVTLATQMAQQHIVLLDKNTIKISLASQQTAAGLLPMHRSEAENLLPICGMNLYRVFTMLPASCHALAVAACVSSGSL